ncbi:hypothetical protein [Methylobacterium sp. J-070]|uniref:hypothetical protein n=1 Tax=Methylobacterium sp. J-070 TaxID=2836650 RepID=UPI001FBB9AFD|nr:hypothetical protein [Methylobacterium sp. J-070]MCJ2051199.1 hypothetical protein [Methylobacterium sp. J-070]
MTALSAEAAEGLRELARPFLSGDRVKAQIGRAARRSGLTYWRAFDVWYGKARRIEAAEIEAIRAARATRAQEEARDEYSILLARIAACEAALGLPAADVAGTRDHAPGGTARGVDRPLDRAGRGLTVPAVGRSLT